MEDFTEAQKTAAVLLRNKFGEMLTGHILLLEAALGVTVEEIHVVRNEEGGLTVTGNIGIHQEDVEAIVADMENFRKSAN